MTIPCDQDKKGCTSVQLATLHQREQDRRIDDVEDGVRNVHKRVDGLLLLLITTLASSLTGTALALINYIGNAGR